MPSTIDNNGALFEQLRPRLTAISCRIVGSRAEAEDIVQDCFIKWRAAEQAALVTPAAWLTTVVRHHSIDRLRQRARDHAALLTATDLLADSAYAGPEQELLQRAELGEALGRLRASLSPAQRLALVLHEVCECSHADIAATLGTTSVNVRQLLARARRRLREAATTDAPEDKLSRELVRRFQHAINAVNVPEMVTLLAGEQPLFVGPAAQLRRAASANDACYRLAA
jgi:RNA polymerase sigma-70 factor (ECF subfamily)